MAGQILQDQSFGAKHPLVREVGGATRQREMAPHHGFVRSYQCLTCLRWASACVNRSGQWSGGEIHTIQLNLTVSDIMPYLTCDYICYLVICSSYIRSREGTR